MTSRPRLHRTAAFALLCTALSAHAQTNSPLTGAALGLAARSVSNDVAYTSSVASINGQSASANETDLGLVGSWGQVLSDRWVAMVGFGYAPGKTDMGRINYTSGGAQSFTAKTKNHMTLFVAPGLRLQPQTVVYGKLSYHRLTADYNDTATGASSRSFSGSGVGVGLAYALAPRLELRADYEVVRYQSELINLTTGKPEQKILSGALLYKF